MRLTALALAAAVSACASHPVMTPAPRVPVSKAASISLPQPPGYPQTRSALQTVVGTYGERKAAFQAALELSPQRVKVVVLASSGPRILNVEWTEAGVREERTPLAPEGLKGENILADIFLCLWPLDAVRASLSPGVEAVEADGVRTLSLDGVKLVEITTTQQADGVHQILRNFEFDYTLSITTRDLE